MTLFVETRHALHPDQARELGTKALRAAFLAQDLFRAGEIRLVYTHYDRFVMGGVVPETGPLTLDHVAETGTANFLDRRELGVVNIGAQGVVRAGGKTYEMARGDVLYLGMGSGPVTFEGAGRFYLTSAPAHRACASVLLPADGCKELHLGAAETANKRIIKQFIHPQVMESCQLILGYTTLVEGSVWNTVPSHIHDRRMEAYLYWGMKPEARVVHLMGEPQETRHLMIANEQGAISPPWSIHSGAGIGEYTFIWAMAGDNIDYTDVEVIAPEALL